jgi:hypothetical protein
MGQHAAHQLAHERIIVDHQHAELVDQDIGLFTVDTHYATPPARIVGTNNQGSVNQSSRSR